MRKLLFVLFSLISLISKGQVYQAMPQYGYGPVKRFDIDSSLTIPTTCGVPTLRTTLTKKAAIAFDSCNNRFYQYNPKTLTWSVISGGGASTDTTSLSNRINAKADTSAVNLKLNISDTINKWVTSVTKLNDSTIRVLKDGTNTDITLTPAATVTSATRLVTTVYNNTGSTIPKGSVVYISGRHSSNLPTIALAQANDEPNSYKTFALVENDITNNNSGIAIQAGKISNLNLPTSTYTDGDIVYLSPTVPGGITITKPLAPYHICKIGSVTRAHPTQGSIEIKIENGWQLDELSDVQIPLVPADSTLLQFSRVDSLWHSVSVTNAIGTNYLKPTDTTSLSNRINTKQNTITLTTTGSSGNATFSSNTLNIPNYGNNDVLIAQAYALLGSQVKGLNLCLPNYAQNGGASSALTNNTMRVFAYYLPKDATITGVKWWQNTIGSYTSANYNGIGLYSYSGGTLTLIASSTNDGNIWQTAASNSMGSKAFSSTYSASAGIYYIAMVYSASASVTGPSITTAALNTQTNQVSFDFTNSAKLSASSVQTSFPSTIAMSTMTASTASYFMWLY